MSKLTLKAEVIAASESATYGSTHDVFPRPASLLCAHFMGRPLADMKPHVFEPPHHYVKPPHFFLYQFEQ